MYTISLLSQQVNQLSAGPTPALTESTSIAPTGSTNASSMAFVAVLAAIGIIVWAFRSVIRGSGPVVEAVRLVIGWTLAMVLVLTLLVGTLFLIIH